ncbi:hypothetical protein CW700_03960 [Candidatus Bathyarchaeota archaeon]|nr:MAG: hypothetical protein CW700_03960 [Candidatus Bathyarchaeota archaeon]
MGVRGMSREGGGGKALILFGKALGVLLIVLGGLVVYYSYKTPISTINPRVVAPLGGFLVGIGGLMLLARRRG